MTATVWFLTSMGSDVLLKVTQLRESAIAQLATVWLHTKMDPIVLRQVRRVGKAFATGCAFKGLLASMN